MNPYWIKFEPMALRRFAAEGEGGAVPSPFDLGVGVTARDEADAVYLARFILGERKIAAISHVTSVNALDQSHVRPNMGNIFVRGVWWPNGYEGIGQRALYRDSLLVYHAIVDVGDPDGVHRRATTRACDLDDAKFRLEAEFGGTIFSLWVDPAFDRPR